MQPSYRIITTTVRFTEWVTEPIVAVTVTVYVPGVVRRDVEIVRVDVAVPSAAKLTLPGLTEPVGQIRTRPDDEIDGLKVTVPERPLRLVKVITDEPDAPHTIVRELGEALMPKSGGGGGGGGVVTLTVWELLAVRPPESSAWTMTVWSPAEVNVCVAVFTVDHEVSHVPSPSQSQRTWIALG